MKHWKIQNLINFIELSMKELEISKQSKYNPNNKSYFDYKRKIINNIDLNFFFFRWIREIKTFYYYL